MIQLATAWDGVALAIPMNGGLLEDCRPVAHGGPAELRLIAQARNDERWRRACHKSAASGDFSPVMLGDTEYVPVRGRHPTDPLEWRTYPNE